MFLEQLKKNTVYFNEGRNVSEPVFFVKKKRTWYVNSNVGLWFLSAHNHLTVKVNILTKYSEISQVKVQVLQHIV